MKVEYGIECLLVMLLVQIESFRILLLLVFFLDLTWLIVVNCLVLGALSWLKLWLFVLLLNLLIYIIVIIFRRLYDLFPYLSNFNFVCLYLTLVIGSLCLVPAWLCIGLRLFELVDGRLILQIPLKMLEGFFELLIFFLCDKFLRIWFFYLLEHFLNVYEWRLVITSAHPLAASQPSLAIGSNFIGLKLEKPVQNEFFVEELWELVAVFNYFVKFR